MNRAFVVPNRYRRVLTAAIANAVADIGRDVDRRARGEPVTTGTGIPDDLLDMTAIGDVMAFVGPIDDGAVAREAVQAAQARDPFKASNAA